MIAPALALASIMAQAAEGIAPLPVGPPIGGPVWSYVVPALLLIVATAATYMLYRHFASKGKGGAP